MSFAEAWARLEGPRYARLRAAGHTPLHLEPLWNEGRPLPVLGALSGGRRGPALGGAPKTRHLGMARCGRRRRSGRSGPSRRCRTVSGPGLRGIRTSRARLTRATRSTSRERRRSSWSDARVAGAGAFETFHPSRQLTDTRAATPSIWRMPATFLPPAGPALSYHEDPARWSRDGNAVLLRAAGRGQEFVLDADRSPGVVEFAERLLDGRRDDEAAHARSVLVSAPRHSGARSITLRGLFALTRACLPPG